MLGKCWSGALELRHVAFVFNSALRWPGQHTSQPVPNTSVSGVEIWRASLSDSATTHLQSHSRIKTTRYEAIGVEQWTVFLQQHNFNSIKFDENAATVLAIPRPTDCA